MSPGSTTSTGGFLASSGSPLPSDILERGRERVRIAALVLVATWVFVIVMNEGIARIAGGESIAQQVWAPRQTVLTLIGLVVSLGVAWLIPKLKGRPELALDIGLGYEIFNSLIVSFITEYYPRHDPQAISWVCVTIRHLAGARSLVAKENSLRCARVRDDNPARAVCRPPDSSGLQPEPLYHALARSAGLRLRVPRNNSRDCDPRTRQAGQQGTRAGQL
jgi:hypothetical protein